MVILLLDDESGALRILTRILTSLCPDAEINAFIDVESTEKFAKENRIDIAFLDIDMPVKNGIEIAKEILADSPDCNIIFTTGYSEYAVQAIRLRSSGYLLKPVTRAKVKSELAQLRNPLIRREEPEKKVFVRTFGEFDIFVDDRPLEFPREKTKEMLAYLVDRRGASVSRKELASVLYGDKEYSRTVQSYLSQLARILKELLDKEEIGAMLRRERNSYSVDPEMFSCDLYEYLEKKDKTARFPGEYMTQYDWAEDRLEELGG